MDCKPTDRNRGTRREPCAENTESGPGLMCTKSRSSPEYKHRKDAITPHSAQTCYKSL